MLLGIFPYISDLISFTHDEAFGLLAVLWLCWDTLRDGGFESGVMMVPEQIELIEMRLFG